MNLYESVTRNLKESYSDTEYAIMDMMSYVLECINSLKVPSKDAIDKELKSINANNDTSLSLNTFKKRVDIGDILHGGPDIGGLNIEEKDIPQAIKVLAAFGFKATEKDFADFLDDLAVDDENTDSAPSSDDNSKSYKIGSTSISGPDTDTAHKIFSLADKIFSNIKGAEIEELQYMNFREDKDAVYALLSNTNIISLRLWVFEDSYYAAPSMSESDADDIQYMDIDSYANFLSKQQELLNELNKACTGIKKAKLQ